MLPPMKSLRAIPGGAFGIPVVNLVLVLQLLALPRAEAEVREWTRASDGRKIQAEFVGMKDDTTIQIKMTNGQTFDVPLASLSEADNAFVKELAELPLEVEFLFERNLSSEGEVI